MDAKDEFTITVDQFTTTAMAFWAKGFEMGNKIWSEGLDPGEVFVTSVIPEVRNAIKEIQETNRREKDS